MIVRFCTNFLFLTFKKNDWNKTSSVKGMFFNDLFYSEPTKGISNSQFNKIQLDTMARSLLALKLII